MKSDEGFFIDTVEPCQVFLKQMTHAWHKRNQWKSYGETNGQYGIGLFLKQVSLWRLIITTRARSGANNSALPDSRHKRMERTDCFLWTHLQARIHAPQ